ncbi:hypothetical protein ACIPV2_01490 [Microbacterium sp. NPDC089987]|uniref:hypothetical protein n=1 Tax=Microbacterium sp. NPDC089987 TaxID=3364202 RepID=UPI00382EB300
MSTLEDLFSGGARRSETPAAVDDQQTSQRLEQLLGDRREELDRTHRASARPALVAMVDSAVADAKPLGTVPPASLADTRRPRRRRDLINVAAAGLAVVALAATGIAGGVQAATASPVTDALRALKADEKTIASASAGLDAARERLTASIADADAAAAQLRPALETVRTATDPADIPPGETEAPRDARTIPIADGKALDDALAAVDAYRADVGAMSVPAPTTAYARARTDESSLTDVAAAIDAAQLQLSEIDRAAAEVRAQRAALDARTATFTAQLATFAATFPKAAQASVDGNPDADKKLKDAVAAAAQAVAAADLLSESGAVALFAYRDAVVALEAGQVYADRVSEERARREAEADQPRTQSPRPQPQPSPTPSDPAPSDPPPADPTPTDPPANSEGSDNLPSE